MKRQVLFIAAIASIIIVGCSDAKGAEDIDASVDVCPYEQPTDLSLSCIGNLSCGYGFECCCDVCSTAAVCRCIFGRFICTDTGVCDSPWCEDAGTDGGTDGG